MKCVWMNCWLGQGEKACSYCFNFGIISTFASLTGHSNTHTHTYNRYFQLYGVWLRWKLNYGYLTTVLYCIIIICIDSGLFVYDNYALADEVWKHNNLIHYYVQLTVVFTLHTYKCVIRINTHNQIVVISIRFRVKFT